MGDVWESDGVVVETWESSTEPGVTFTTVIREGDIVTGGSGVDLSDATPAALGTAAPGVGTEASRADHVHDMPTAGDVGAAAASHTHNGTQVTIDASGFDGNLTTGDDTVQKVAQKVDDLATGGGGPDLSDTAPQDLGTAAAGVSTDASRADHVHDMPTAADVGAATEVQVSPSALAGVKNFGLPNTVWSSVNNVRALSPGRIWFTPFLTYSPMVVDRIWCDVTTGAAGNLRMGVYAADEEWQPTGPALIDTGNIDASTTGGKTATVSATLPPGRYLACIVASAAASIRAGQAMPTWGSDFYAASLGGTGSIIQGSYRKLTFPYAALPSGSSVNWDSVVAAGINHASDQSLILLRWT